MLGGRIFRLFLLGRLIALRRLLFGLVTAVATLFGGAAISLGLCIFSRGLLGDGLLRIFQLDRVQKYRTVLVLVLLLCPLAVTGNGSQICRDGRIILFGLTAAQNRNICIGEGVNHFRLVFHFDLDPLAEQVNFHHSTPTLRGVHKGFGLGGGAEQIFISVLLVFQAAHQSAAGAGNFGGIQAEILGFCHFDRHRLEIIQEACTAEGASADTQTAYHLCLVPDTDLPQLNAGMEGACQGLDQLSEVYPFVSGEEEENPAAVKGAFRRYQLHIQLLGGNLLHTKCKGFLFLCLIFRGGLLVLVVGNPKDRAQGRNDILDGYGVVAGGAEAVLRTAGGVDNYVVTGFQLVTCRIKIINFLPGAELNVHHLCLFRRLGQVFVQVFHCVLLIIARPIAGSRRSQLPICCLGHIL